LSEFRKPKQCNKCTQLIYFDATKKSQSGKFIPLDKDTGLAHACQKKNESNGSSMATAISKSESIHFAETLSALLKDYLRLKSQEVAAAK
jgi:hypothetical protein